MNGSMYGNANGYGQSYPMNYGSPYGGGFGFPYGDGYGSPFGGGYGMQGYGNSFGGGYGGGYGMQPQFGGFGMQPFQGGSMFGSGAKGSMPMQSNGMPNFAGKGAQQAPQTNYPLPGPGTSNSPTLNNMSQLPPGSQLPNGYRFLTNQVAPGVDTGVYYPPGTIGKIPTSTPAPTGGPVNYTPPPFQSQQQPGMAPTGGPVNQLPSPISPPPQPLLGGPAPVGAPTSPNTPPPMQTPLTQAAPPMSPVSALPQTPSFGGALNVMNKFHPGFNSSLPGIPSFGGRIGGFR